MGSSSLWKHIQEISKKKEYVCTTLQQQWLSDNILAYWNQAMEKWKAEILPTNT